MSYSNGNDGPPFQPGRTASTSYAPSSAMSMNYFQNEAQQQQHYHPPSAYQTHHQMPWPPMGLPQPGPSASTSASHAQAITSDLPGDSKRTNSMFVESPAESRSDTDDPSMLAGPSGSASKRKNTDDQESSRSKKKRNRAVLSCAPCKSRKVS